MGGGEYRRPLGARAMRRVGVVVDARGGELAAVATDVDGEAGFGRQLRPAPGDHVVLQRAGAAVVGDGAVLKRDAAAIGEERLVERAQLVGAPVDVAIAGGLAHVPVGLERGEDRLEVAGRERALILADDVRLGEVEGRLKQRRTVRVAAGQRPGAEVQAQLEDALVLLVVVAGERKGKTDASAVAVEVEHDLFDPARIRDEEVDVLDIDIAFRQPGGRIGDEAPKRAFALDAPAYRVMHLWHTRERLEERVDLSGHQAVEEGHRSEALMPVLVQDPLQRGSGEQLRRKRHATSIPWTPRFGGPSDRYTAGVSHLLSIHLSGATTAGARLSALSRSPRRRSRGSSRDHAGRRAGASATTSPTGG